MVWWIASGADDEQYKGRTASRDVFLSWCGVFYLVRISLSLFLFSPSFPFLFSLPSSFSSALFLWWLDLFIEALVVFPNNEREGRQQLAILKGNI